MLAALACVGLAAQTEVRRPVSPSVLPSYKDLKYSPLPPIKIPEPATLTLANGLKIFLLEDHELPVVSGFALIRTGNLFDPPDKRGLAGITGETIRAGGTKSKTGDQIDEQLEDMAASVESHIGESNGTLSFSSLKENTDQVLAVYADVMMNPEFRQDKVDLAITQLRSGIARRNDDPGGIVEREFSSVLYGRDTPYGWDVQYTHAGSIRRKDVIDFYRRYYFPGNIALAIYGDFSTDEMKEKLTRLFAAWTANQPPVPKFPEVRKLPVPGVFLAAKPDVTQTFFEIGHLGGVLNDKDYPALEVTAEILGGGFSSRLFQRVRTQLGYAYNINATWGARYDHPGLFTIGGSTQSLHTVDTLRAIREELDRIRAGEVTDQELQTAKDTALNSFVFYFDRPSKTLNRLMIYQYYGYPKDFIFQFQKAVASVTKTDVLRAARKYLKPEDLTIVAVGNPADFKTPLTELGLKVQPIDLTIPEPAKETPPVSPANLEKGKQLLRRVQQALGGADKLAAVKDITYQADVEIQTPGGALKATQRNLLLLPGAMRQEAQLPFGKHIAYSDGQSGWMLGPQGPQNLPAPVQKQIRGELFRQLFTLALSDRDPGRKVNAVADDAVEISDAAGESVRVQIDPASGLPMKLTYSGEGMGAPGDVEERYADWRDVGGLKVPYKITINQNGKKFADVTITDYKINSGVTIADLSKKP
jgi:zinc protease